MGVRIRHRLRLRLSVRLRLRVGAGVAEVASVPAGESAQARRPRREVTKHYNN